eukprot:761851-Hanusia_phi.AAC.1
MKECMMIVLEGRIFGEQGLMDYNTKHFHIFFVSCIQHLQQDQAGKQRGETSPSPSTSERHVPALKPHYPLPARPLALT